MRVRVLSVVAAVLGALLCAPAAHAEDDAITSFDGTRIVLHWFKAEGLRDGQRAPTVLFGPGWSSGGDTNEDGTTSEQFGSIGVGALRKAGYNVLTWDPRGFGQSGGTVTVDAPDKEGRDVQALFDYVAKRPEALLDAPGDPRVGMTGASYGGGIQLVVAAIDDRVDAIVPDIAWHSLQTSLYRDDTFKGGWGAILYAAGKARGRLDPHIDSAFNSAAASGRISEEDRRWFISRGPGELVERIRIPTLLTQGTVDTLFTLDEAVTNYAILRRNRVPVKMLWFCGGHGSCLTPAGPTGRIEKAALAWLGRWLKRDRRVDTGPRFDGLDQLGRTFTASDYPLAPGTPLTGTGAGTLPLAPGSTSGSAIAGTRAPNAVNVTVPAASSERLIAGMPRLRVTYRGTAANPDARVYAQVVDDETGIVLGNQVTPIPVTLDGQQRTLEKALETVAATATPGRTFTLQLFPSSTVYDVQRTSGAVTFESIRIELPTADRSTGPPGYPAGPAARKPRLGIRSIARISRTRPKGAIRPVVAPLNGTVRNVTVTLLSRKGGRLATSGPRTIDGATRFVLTPGRGVAPGELMRVVASGRRPDGTLITAKRWVRKPR